VAIAKRMSAKLARRSRLTGGSPARVRPKIEYSPVFASPSAIAALAATLPSEGVGRDALRSGRNRRPVAPERDIELLQVENVSVRSAIEQSSNDHYRDEASQVSRADGSFMPR
jgi:hypothetical protein